MTSQLKSKIENINMKLKLKFKRKYEKKKDNGEITNEQYKEVCRLIEDLEKISPEKFKKKLVDIFPNSQVKKLIVS